jgi:hypothetical protein
MTFDMSWLAYSAIILGALVFGAVVQVYFTPKSAYEWLVTAIGAGIGAWFVSELTWSATNINVGPTWEGLLVIPAAIGGLVLGALFEVVARTVETAPTPA